MHQRERALHKLRLELTKDIRRAVSLAKRCGMWEMLRFAYLLHFVRLSVHLPERRGELGHADVAAMHLIEESLKYSIGLIANNSDWARQARHITKQHRFNNEFAITLLKLSNHINSKFEFESLLQLADVEVYGERDQHCKIDFEGVLKDHQKSALFDYFFRIDQCTFFNKDRALDADTLLGKFVGEYAAASDLFRSDTGMSLEEYKRGVTGLLALIEQRWKNLEPQLARLPNGNIDIGCSGTFFPLAQAMFVSRHELISCVGKGFLSYMEKNRFSRSPLNNSELRFHHLTRRPFLVGESFALVSPEIVLDSVFTNTHFSLIESRSTRAEYLERRSRQFVDRIAEVAITRGLVEISRDIFLREGKTELGDIDLWLRDAGGRDILVEAKNHALPLGVYFKSAADTRSHLERTKREWETKVTRRLDHLRRYAQDYGIQNGFAYVIVTQHPEVLSHFSDVLTLTVDEWDFWLQGGAKVETFHELFSSIYDPYKNAMSPSNLRRLHKDGLFLGRFGDADLLK